MVALEVVVEIVVEVVAVVVLANVVKLAEEVVLLVAEYVVAVA